MTVQDDRDRLAVLVHEVRSPVAALSAIAEALADDDLDEATRRELTGLAIAAATSVERVVSDAAVGSIRLEAMDVARLVRESVTTAELGGAQVRASIASDLPVIAGDPVRLRQALDNLVANAVAHSPPGGEVVVAASLREEEKEVLLTVTDAGEGIPIGDQTRIFDSGVRLNADRPGLGFGLAVARAVADAHGGRLTVQSAPGEGATFTIALPVGRG